MIASRIGAAWEADHISAERSAGAERIDDRRRVGRWPLMLIVRLDRERQKLSRAMQLLLPSVVGKHWL